MYWEEKNVDFVQLGYMYVSVADMVKKNNEYIFCVV